MTSRLLVLVYFSYLICLTFSSIKFLSVQFFYNITFFWTAFLISDKIIIIPLIGSLISFKKLKNVQFEFEFV